MFRTPTKADYQKQLQTLARKASDLYERAERGETMTARDLAQAIEYNSQYLDILSELEHADFEIETGDVEAITNHIMELVA